MSYFKSIKQIALPVVGEQLLQMTMATIDQYVLSYLGLAVLSGVAVANQIITIYQAIFLALGTAISSAISAQTSKKAQVRLLSEGARLTLYLSIFFGLLTLILASPLLSILGTSEAVTPFAYQYLVIMALGLITIGLNTVFSAFLRAKGFYHFPITVNLLANAINLCLSLLSVYVWQYGLIGVALATVISRVIAILCLFHKTQLSIAQLIIIPSSRTIFRLAVPTILERLMMRGGDLVTLSLLAHFGTKALASNAIGEAITQFNYLFGFAIATAILILASKERQAPARLTTLLRQSYLTMLISMLSVSLAIFVLKEPIIHLFTPDKQVIALTSLIVGFSLLGIPVTAATLSLTAFWQGLGNTKLPLYATSLGMWGIRIGIGYLLSQKIGISGIYLGTLLDNLFRSLLMWSYYRKRVVS